MANNTTPAAAVTVDSIVQSVLDGKREFLSLDFSTAQGKESALRCMDIRQPLALQLNANDPVQCGVLKSWIEKKYSNLLLLSREQRNKYLIDVYLEQKFNEQLLKWNRENNSLAKSVSIIHSYKKQQLICYNYVTKEGEAVSYFDKVLSVPVKLKVQARFRLKLIDALKLVEAIDVELERVDLGLTVNFLNNKIIDNLRETLLGIIEAKKATYYELPRYFVLIKEQLTMNLQRALASCGIVVSGVEINDISITNNTGEKLESQYFALAEVARVKEFENRIEAASLRLYEQKAMIHEKYPSFPAGLTEAEKDFALNRYLKRVGQEKELVADIEEEELGKREEHETVVTKAEPTKAVAPVEPKRSKKYVAGMVFGCILWLAISIALILLSSTRIYGCILCGAGAVALIITGIVLRYELKNGYSKKEGKEYDEKLRAYIEQTKPVIAGMAAENPKLKPLLVGPASLTNEPAEILDKPTEIK